MNSSLRPVLRLPAQMLQGWVQPGLHHRLQLGLTSHLERGARKGQLRVGIRDHDVTDLLISGLDVCVCQGWGVIFASVSGVCTSVRGSVDVEEWEVLTTQLFTQEVPRA